MTSSNQEGLVLGGVIISIAIGCLTRAAWGWIGVGVVMIIVSLVSHFCGDKKEKEEE
jgi:hypothetical protein